MRIGNYGCRVRLGLALESIIHVIYCNLFPCGFKTHKQEENHELENRHQFLKTLEIDSFIFWGEKKTKELKVLSIKEYPLTKTKGYGQKLELANIVKKKCKQELRNEQIIIKVHQNG